MLTPPASPVTETAAPTLRDNAVLNDPETITRYIIRDRNDNELWRDGYSIENLFQEAAALPTNNTISTNTEEDSIVEESDSNSNDNTSTVSDIEPIATSSIEQSNGNTIIERAVAEATTSTDNIIDTIPSLFDIGIRSGMPNAPWHWFSANDLLIYVAQNLNDLGLSPLAFFILAANTIMATFTLKLYFNTLRYTRDILNNGVAYDINVLNRFTSNILLDRMNRNVNIETLRILRQQNEAIQEIVLRAPLFVSRRFPRLAEVRTGVPRVFVRLHLIHLITFGSVALSLNALKNNMNETTTIKDYLKDIYNNKDKKLFIPFVFCIPVEKVKEFYNYIDFSIPAHISLVTGLVMLTYAAYLIFELVLLYIVHLFGSFKTETINNRLLRGYLKMINNYCAAPHSIRIHLKTIRVALQYAIVNIFVWLLYFFYHTYYPFI